MKKSSVLANIREVLDFELFSVSNVTVNVATLLVFVLLILGAMLVSWLARHAIRRSFLARGVTAEGTIGATSRLVHYAIMLIGVGVALDTVGVSLNALFAAGAVFAVAIGFAMRNIVENFISGIILLIERVLKPGDIIDVEGERLRIVDMRIRTTVGRTLDGQDVIIPNAVLVQNVVKNQTMRDRLHRIHVFVGVTYGSDMKLVRETLESVVKSHADQERHYGEGSVLMVDFGDSSVVWRVVAWIEEPFKADVLSGKLREKIWWALKEAGVTIAFPQLDVHFDENVENAFTAMGRS